MRPSGGAPPFASGATREGFGEDEFAYVKVASPLEYEFRGSVKTVRWAVSLVSQDSRIYAYATKSGSYDPTTAGTGSGINFAATFPLSFPGVTTTNLRVENQGNFKTPPTFTVTGAVVNPIIDNDTTGESIYTTGLSLLAGESAVIYVDARTLTIAGVERPDLIDPRQTKWFELAPGVNLLRLRGTGTVGGQTQLAVSYRDARI